MSGLPGKVWLFGEREFPTLEIDNHQPVEAHQLRLSPSTTGLLIEWLAVARNDLAEEHDAILLAGLRAAVAVARELAFRCEVNFSMRDPRNGDWISLDLRCPS